MKVVFSLVVVSFALLLFGCGTQNGLAGSERYKARSTNEGLVPLTNEELEETFRGKNFKSPDGSWTWDFDEAGLAQSLDSNKKKLAKDQRWSIENDKLCRSLKGDYPCVSVYRADGVIRLGLPDSNKLNTWAIVPR